MNPRCHRAAADASTLVLASERRTSRYSLARAKKDGRQHDELPPGSSMKIASLALFDELLAAGPAVRTSERCLTQFLGHAPSLPSQLPVWPTICGDPR